MDDSFSTRASASGIIGALLVVVGLVWVVVGSGNVLASERVERCVDASSPGRSDAELACLFSEYLPRLMRRYAADGDELQDLDGVITVGLEIAPTGQLKNTWLVQSDVQDQDFVNHLLDGLYQVDFGEKDVGTVSVEFAFQFVAGAPFAAPKVRSP